MAVSVIIPTYNRRETLERALQSVYAQVYSDYEIILVDDASTDGTAAWLPAAHPKVKLIVLPQNQGAAAARNVGIQSAQGEVIAFLDSDDEWHPDYLEQQLRALAAQPEAVLSYTRHYAVVSGNSRGHVVTCPLNPSDLVRSMLLGNFIQTLSVVVMPKWALDAVGLFDERLLICHDRELYLRLFEIGSPAHVPEFLVTKFWEPNSLVAAKQCQIWLADGLRLLEIFYKNSANAPYLPLRSEAAQRFRDRVQGAQPFFARVADRNT
jgi:glycosyltransferase involved in cell wall biosynthesis